MSAGHSRYLENVFGELFYLRGENEYLKKRIWETRRADKRCYTCGMVGHLARACCRQSRTNCNWRTDRDEGDAIHSDAQDQADTPTMNSRKAQPDMDEGYQGSPLPGTDDATNEYDNHEEQTVFEPEAECDSISESHYDDDEDDDESQIFQPQHDSAASVIDGLNSLVSPNMECSTDPGETTCYETNNCRQDQYSKSSTVSHYASSNEQISSTGFWASALRDDTPLDKEDESSDGFVDVLVEDWCYVEPWTSLAKRIREIHGYYYYNLT